MFPLATKVGPNTPYIVQATHLFAKAASDEAYQREMGHFMADFTVSTAYTSIYGRAQKLVTQMAKALEPISDLLPIWAMQSEPSIEELACVVPVGKRRCQFTR